MRPVLYRISIYNQVPSADAAYPPDRCYEGQLVFAGPDAAIEVIDTAISGYIGGIASHPQGQLADLIDNYGNSIRKQTRKIAGADTAAVIYAGKWHHVDPEMKPRFEAYLVHLVSKDGTVVTRRYALDIFDWDHEPLNNGGGFHAGGGKNVIENARQLRAHAELKLRPGKHTSRNGLYAIEGIMWFPEDSERLPIVYSNLNGRDAQPRILDAEEDIENNGTYLQGGDGTIVGELRTRARLLSASPGKFRGETVDRKTHRPPEMTFAEVFESTDALGYWFQTQDGESEPEMAFRFSCGSSDAEEILIRVDPSDDPWAYGSLYASKWSALSKAMPNYRKRILAVGTIPAVPAEPL